MVYSVHELRRQTRGWHNRDRYHNDRLQQTSLGSLEVQYFDLTFDTEELLYNISCKVNTLAFLTWKHVDRNNELIKLFDRVKYLSSIAKESFWMDSYADTRFCRSLKWIKKISSRLLPEGFIPGHLQGKPYTEKMDLIDFQNFLSLRTSESNCLYYSIPKVYHKKNTILVTIPIENGDIDVEYQLCFPMHLLQELYNDHFRESSYTRLVSVDFEVEKDVTYTLFCHGGYFNLLKKAKGEHAFIKEVRHPFQNSRDCFKACHCSLEEAKNILAPFDTNFCTSGSLTFVFIETDC